MNTSVEFNLLSTRARYRSLVRTFFEERFYIEVDTPAFSKDAPLDAYIDPFFTGDFYLHTSPEYAMKELLAKYKTDIFFLGHVFRKEEVSPYHRPEFTMCEWYKTHTDEEIFLNEVVEFIQLFLGPLPHEKLSYETAFKRYSKTLPLPSHWTEEEKRHYTFAETVEPHLGEEKITILTNFPKEDAALATTTLKDGRETANRFEFFYKGKELANGFNELTDPIIQKERFVTANKKRQEMNKPTLPIDENLLASLPFIPKDTYGMAAGFDRLLMLALNIPHIDKATF